MELVKHTYKTTTHFLESEKFVLTSQLHRSVISIPCNIAEGYGRNSPKDFIRFSNISMGSLFEYQTQLQISLDIKI